MYTLTLFDACPKGTFLGADGQVKRSKITNSSNGVKWVLAEFLIANWIYVALLLAAIYMLMRHEGIKGGAKLSTTQVTMLVNKDDAVVIDLRTKSEFEAGHIANSVNIGHDKITASDAVLKKYKDKPIILVDKAGQHAGAVGKELLTNGFNVSRLGGGIAEWQQQTLPLVKD